MSNLLIMRIKPLTKVLPLFYKSLNISILVTSIKAKAIILEVCYIFT